MSDEPRPTTGEAEKLADWILNRLPATGGGVDFTRLELETRINAALAAVSEQAEYYGNQLIVERWKYSKITHKWELCVVEIQQLRDQLAAEREKHA